MKTQKQFTRRRPDDQFSLHYFLFNTKLTLIGAIGFCLMGIHVWVGAAIFIGSVLTLIIFDHRKMRNFKCPVCDATLPKPSVNDFPDENTIIFICENCDIEWETDLIYGSD